MQQRRRKDPSFWDKLKKIEIKKRYVVLAVFLALVVRFWGENTITLLQKKIPIITAKEISLEDINHYIQTKQQYISDHITINPELIKNKNLETLLDDDTHEWFLVRQWRPSRFFYVDQRIKLIVSCIQKQEQQLDEADILEEKAYSLIQMSDFIQEDTVKRSIQPAALEKRAQDLRYFLKKEIRRNGISIPEEENIKDYMDDLIPLVEQ